jgi:hypothetical protein
MQAIEFDSVANNGVILVPSEYVSLFNAPVRVIVLSNDRETSVTPKKKLTFPEFEKKWAGAFKLSDESYDDTKFQYLKDKYL